MTEKRLADVMVAILYFGDPPRILDQVQIQVPGPVGRLAASKGTWVATRGADELRHVLTLLEIKHRLFSFGDLAAPNAVKWETYPTTPAALVSSLESYDSSPASDQWVASSTLTREEAINRLDEWAARQTAEVPAAGKIFGS